MAQWLRDDGLLVDECSTVEQAVARYQGQEFDVVVTELRLDSGSGLDLIRQIRETDDCASAVVVTQYADMAAAVATLREGATDFLAKPFRLTSSAPLCTAPSVAGPSAKAATNSV